jgi:hypothetical protein
LDGLFGTTYTKENGYGMLGVCRSGSLKTVASELGKCNLDLVAVQEARWDKDGSQPADICIFFY